VLAWLAVQALALVGCAARPREVTATPQARRPLPPPARAGPLSLEEALARRRSIREYTEQGLTEEQIGQLLWAAQGETHPQGLRTAPSAGALYPLETYVATPEGLYHYSVAEHALELLVRGDLRTSLWEVSLRQDAVRRAPAVFVMGAVYARTERRYGRERTPCYVHMEVGHAAQNLLLQAVALDLGGVVIGAFDDAGVQRALSLPAEQQPLYVIPVGHPARGAEG
jgi:SagB-type dehydrogenase family enzyme